MPLAVGLLIAASAAQCAAPPLPRLAEKAYPGAIELCRGHLTSSPQPDAPDGMNITFIVYHSPDPQETVTAHYTKTLGAENHTRQQDADVWRFPIDKPVDIVNVKPASSALPFAACKAPPSTARTLIAISNAARP